MSMRDLFNALGSDAAAAFGSFYGYGGTGFASDPSTINRNADGSISYSAGMSNPYNSISPYRYSNMDSKDMPADKLYADLIRAQTQDYLNRFAPVENFLASEITATGTQALAGDLERTQSAIMDAGMSVQGQQNRQMERYGLAGNSNIAGSNSQVSALVGGLNDTRLRDIDRRTMLLSGGMSGITQKARNVGVA